MKLKARLSAAPSAFEPSSAQRCGVGGVGCGVVAGAVVVGVDAGCAGGIVWFGCAAGCEVTGCEVVVVVLL